MTMTLRSLRKENRRRIEELVPEDRELLFQIREYFEMPSMGAADREILIRDLVGMAEEARLRGENFSQVMGEEKKHWCENLRESYGTVQPIEKVLYSLKSTFRMASLYWMFFMAWTEEMRHTVTWGRLLALSAILIIGFIGEYSGAEKRNFAFYTEKEKTQSEAKTGIFWLGLMAMAGLAGYLLQPLNVPAFHFSWASYIVWCVLLAAFFLFSFIYDRWINLPFSFQ
jgi:DNA-binding ferritin-like protein (Dps family)